MLRDIIVITPDKERNKFESEDAEAEYFRLLRLGEVSDLDGFEGRVVNIQDDHEATLITLA